MGRMSVFLAAGAAALFLGGCKNPIVGEWEYELNDATYNNEFTLEGDGSGEWSTAYITEGATIKGDVEWEDSGDEKYDLTFECKSVSGVMATCLDLQVIVGLASKFDVECEINKDKDELDCTNPGGQPYTMKKKD